jgi:hypothetical protein
MEIESGSWLAIDDFSGGRFWIVEEWKKRNGGRAVYHSIIEH